MNNYPDYIKQVADADVKGLEKKDKEYGSSWCRRGGAGAFHMLSRKWDRIEALLEKPGPLRWDIFEHALQDQRQEGVIDDIRDLRRYLMLVESYILAEQDQEQQREMGRHYVCQDPDITPPRQLELNFGTPSVSGSTLTRTKAEEDALIEAMKRNAIWNTGGDV